MTESERFEIGFGDGALSDLDEIAAFMTEVRGRDEAAALVTTLLDRAETLGTFPRRGAVPKEMLELDEVHCRQIVHKQYRIIYLVIGSTVRVAMIADGRRDMPALLRERLGLADPHP